MDELRLESAGLDFARPGLAGLWDAAEAGVAAEQEVAGKEGFRFESCAVGGDEEPVTDFAAEQSDGANGGEVLSQGWIGGSGGIAESCFGEDEPEPVVRRGFEAVA